jgi:hypothetical protein
MRRRYSDGIMQPNYPEAEVIQSLRFAGAVGLMAAVELATLSNNHKLAADTVKRARLYTTPR